MASIGDKNDMMSGTTSDAGGLKRGTSVAFQPLSTMQSVQGGASVKNNNTSLPPGCDPKGDEFTKKHGADGRFNCNCPACKSHNRQVFKDQGSGKTNPVDILVKTDDEILEESFTWLMEHLIPPNPDKFKGCALIFPDTAFFQNGKPTHIIKCDKDFCLIKVTNQQKLNLTNLQKDFQSVVKDRRIDQNGVFSQLYHKNFQLKAINKLHSMNDGGDALSPDRMRSVETSLLSTQMKNRGMSNKSLNKQRRADSNPKGLSTTLKTTIGENGKGSETNPGERRSKFYKDLVVIRKQEKMLAQIYTDNTFQAKFSAKNQADKDITCIQTCLKAKSGLGIPFFVKFYAKINWQDPKSEIVYDFRSYGEDIELIEHDEQKYCELQCVKIGYFISKLHNIEIIRMHCEFLKDENNSIWFTYAHNIACRVIHGRGLEEIKTKKISYINKDHQAQLIEQLEQHREDQKRKGKQNIETMFNQMSRHYEKIKEHLGLDDALAPSSEDEKDNYIQMIEQQKREFKQRIKERRILIQERLTGREVDPIISKARKNEIIKRDMPKLASMGNLKRKATSVRTPGMVSIKPDIGDDSIRPGYGAAKRFTTRTLINSPSSEFQQAGKLGGGQTTLNDDLHLQEPKFRFADRPKSAAFSNNFGPKKRMHQKKSQSLLSTAASNPRFMAARHQSGTTSHKPGKEVMERGRLHDVIDSLENGQTNQTVQQYGSIYAMTGNRLSIQYLEQSSRDLVHSGSGTTASNIQKRLFAQAAAGKTPQDFRRFGSYKQFAEPAEFGTAGRVFTSNRLVQPNQKYNEHMYIIQSNRNLPQFNHYSKQYFNQKASNKPSKYNHEDSRERLANQKDEQILAENDQEFERLRRQINANTKNKVSQVLETAKQGDHHMFDKLIDEIEERAQEQQKQLIYKNLHEADQREMLEADEAEVIHYKGNAMHILDENSATVGESGTKSALKVSNQPSRVNKLESELVSRNASALNKSNMTGNTSVPNNYINTSNSQLNF